MKRLLHTGLLAALVLAVTASTALAFQPDKTRLSTWQAGTSGPSLRAGSLHSRALEPVVGALAPARGKYFTLKAALRETLAGRARLQATTPAFSLLTGSCALSGHVYGFSGTAAAGAEVDLFYPDGSGSYMLADWTTADGLGYFEFTNLPETSDAYFEVWVDDDHAFQSWGNAVTAAGPNTFTFQPGVLGANVVRTSDPGWNWWRWVRIETWGSAGGGTTWLNDPEEDGVADWAWAMPPDGDYAIAYPYDNQGIEWRPASAAPVLSGALSHTTMQFDQADGRGAWIKTPYWASGKPGTSVRLVLENWPTGLQMSFYGYNQFTPGTVKQWPYYLESGGTTFSTTLTVPATTRAGYDYELHTYRYDDPLSLLDLTTYFQVCTLTSGKSSVRSGGAVKLSGVIPTEGHDGSDPGKVKYVTLYKRTRSVSAAPTTWDATRKGWTKVKRIKANGFGKYSTYVQPSRTTWYVVRYPGDGWYFDAYTSVLRVRVY
jgi:hypothetical protein